MLKNTPFSLVLKAPSSINHCIIQSLHSHSPVDQVPDPYCLLIMKNLVFDSFNCPAVVFILLFSSFLYTASPVQATTAPDCTDISTSVLAAEKWLSDHADHHVDRLVNFLRIESVSSDPSRAPAVRDAAAWLRQELTVAGMQNVQLLESPRHPSVFAEWKPNTTSKATTILLYAHYDVQPEDPISEWTKTKTSPFDPFIDVDQNRVYARGASDDKGSLYTIIAALRAWITSTASSTIASNLHIKVLFEGEEEIGSPNLPDILRTHGEMLRADFGFSADGGMVDEKTPSLCVSLRGALALEVNVRVADSDMHSGTYGGGVMNPVIALSYLIAGLRDEITGKVLVEGFYDGVRELSEDDKKDIADFPIAIDDVLKTLGVNESCGEEGFSFRERTWTRPSLDVIGIYGGFQGTGVKTVLPREATAKLSSRIVADQSSKKVLAKIQAHLLKAAKEMTGILVTVKDLGFSSEPAHVGKSSLGNAAAAAVLTPMYGRDPVYVRFGGSIPAVGLLQSVLGIDVTMYSFALSDENVHAPDEFARIEQLRRSEIAYVRLFGEFVKRGLDSCEWDTKEDL